MSTISASTTTTTAFKVTSDTTGTLVLQTGSTPTTAVTIDTSGNFGIGTGSPAAKLHVQGAVGSLAALFSDATNYTLAIARSGATGSVGMLYGTSGSSLALGANGTEAARIDTSGNLGIGTTSPATRLDVVGTVKVTSSSTLSQYWNSASGAYTSWQNNGTTVGDIGTGNQAVSGGAAGDFGLTSRAGNLVFGTSSAERMRLTTAGNLGIGTTSPSYQLVVSNAGAAGLEISPTGGIASGGFIQSYNRSTSAYFAHTNYATSWYWNNGGASSLMTLDTSGNLGIGTSAVVSACKLNVAGGINSANGAINVQGSGGFYNSANKFGLDNNGGATRLYSSGANSSTKGSYEFHITDSVGTLDTTAMTLDSSGNFNVGSGGLGGLGAVSFYPSGNGAGSATVQVFNKSNTTTDPAIQFRVSGTTVAAISYTNTTITYATSSDYRLKSDVQPMTGALARVAALKPVTYKWNIDGSDGEGFIAHELAQVCPQAVAGEKDAMDAEGKPVYQGVDTSFLVATLAAAIQELKAEFDAYKASHP